MVENVSRLGRSAGRPRRGPMNAVEPGLGTLCGARALANLRIRSNVVLSMSGNAARVEDRVVRVGRGITVSLER